MIWKPFFFVLDGTRWVKAVWRLWRQPAPTDEAVFIEWGMLCATVNRGRRRLYVEPLSYLQRRGRPPVTVKIRIEER